MQRISYDQLGYNQYFQRRDPSEAQTAQNDPNYLGSLMDAYSQTTPASLLSGGIIQSQNGNLQIDLTSGKFLYNDGVQNLFSLGGSSNNMTLNDSSGNILLTSGTSSTSTTSNSVQNTTNQ